jgi:hypothetical protein
LDYNVNSYSFTDTWDTQSPLKVNNKTATVNLPQNAIVLAVHGTSDRAAELAGEILVVGEWANDAEAARAVRISQNLLLETLGCFDSAPQVCVREEEDLIGRELLQTGQLRLSSVGGHVEVVGSVSFTQTAVVGNVLALSGHSVHLFIVGIGY